MRRAFLILGLALSSSPLVAQAAPPGPRASDVQSMDAILAALYDVISGPAGQQRDWDRMRNLFVPGARLIPAVYRPDSVPTLRQLSVEDYITRAGPHAGEERLLRDRDCAAGGAVRWGGPRLQHL